MAAAGLVAMVTFGGAAPAAVAHDALVASSPAAGSTVTEVDTVALTFSDTLLNLAGIESAFVIQVNGPDDLYYGSGCTQLSGAVISTDAALGAGGEYSVEWQVVSADGHPISDTYTFDYEPAAGTVEAAGLTEPPSCGAETAEPLTAVATPGPGPSGLLVGLLLGGGFIVVVGLVTVLLIRHTRRIE